LAIATSELWPAPSDGSWVYRRWRRLRGELIQSGQGWEIWVQWYEDRMAGRVQSSETELTYGNVPAAVWQQGIDGDPAVVNTWIMRRFDSLRGEDHSDLARDTLIAEPLGGDEPDETSSPTPLPTDPPDISAIPAQASAATQFTTTAAGLVDVAADPPSGSPLTDAIQRHHYQEVRHKVRELAKLGHNQLGDLVGPTDRFLAAVPERLEDVSISRLWSRGNTLRRRLKASDAASSDPTDPARLMPLAVESLRDLVETYNVFIIGDPTGRELDQVRLGPQDRHAAQSVMDAAAPMVGAILTSEGMVTQAVKEALAEQLERPPEVWRRA
jgi:hypothetical protein